MEKTVICCPTCQKKLRIPVLDKKIRVSCPCGNLFECISGTILEFSNEDYYKHSDTIFDLSTGLIQSPAKELAGFWVNDWVREAKCDIDKTFLQIYNIEAHRKGQISKDLSTKLHFYLEFGFRVVPNQFDNCGGLFIMFSPYLAPGEKIKMIDGFPAENGSKNPTTNEVERDMDTSLIFSCPTCKTPMSQNIEGMDGTGGACKKCVNCENICHIPSAILDEDRPDDICITAGVLVPINEFGDWYLKHPAIDKMLECKNVEAYCYYGLFAYCRHCNHEFSYTVIRALWMVDSCKEFIFSAKSEASDLEMNSLRKGKCPKCGCDKLIAILAYYTLTPEHIEKLEAHSEKNN